MSNEVRQCKCLAILLQSFWFINCCCSELHNNSNTDLKMRKSYFFYGLYPSLQIIDECILCVHGGLSPDIKTLDQIRTIERHCEIPHKGAFCDLVWSDPEEVDSWAISPRGAGWLFGSKVTQEVWKLQNHAVSYYIGSYISCIFYSSFILIIWS